MTSDDLLKAICGRDSRPICQNPWTVVVDGATYSAATDGMRALFIADGRSPYPAAPLTTVLERLLRTSEGYEGEDVQVLSRAELLAIVGEGAPVDWGAQCHRCNGEGHEECDLGHEHDCEACEGRGSINGVNSYSLSSAVKMRINAGGRYAIIDTQLLRGVIANLPGDPIRVVIGTHGQCFFSGDGWALVVAAMKNHQPGKSFRSIEARLS